ncbi:MAG: hypothetical protein AAGB93_00530 [Planctomycetota bacterium]
MVTTFSPVTGGVVRSDGAFIPDDAGNADWAEYQELVAAGGVLSFGLGPALSQVKVNAKLELDRQAEDERLYYLSLDGAAVVQWHLRALEAAAALADGQIDPGEYPLLEAEIPELGADVAAVAAAVETNRAAVVTKWALIQDVLRTAKASIDAQTDTAGVEAVLVAVTWPVRDAPPTGS